MGDAHADGVALLTALLSKRGVAHYNTSSYSPPMAGEKKGGGLRRIIDHGLKHPGGTADTGESGAEEKEKPLRARSALVSTQREKGGIQVAHCDGAGRAGCESGGT